MDENSRTKIMIAGCFHDLGIWTAETFDYLPPSIELASHYLNENGLDDWRTQIGAMIGEHHKLRAYKDDGLVETFRRGDLADFSLGIVRHGVPRRVVKDAKAAFPNAGFHAGLIRLAGRWICRHPLNPVPVLKW